MKSPLIGVTAVYDYQRNVHWLGDDYCSAISQCGAVPVLIPSSLPQKQVLALVNQLDGLLLSGGDDVNPLSFGQEPVENMGLVDPLRDNLELTLTKEFMRTQKPILGICRGLQVINIVLGGTIIQDLSSHCKKWIGHSQKGTRSYASHSVEIVRDSLLYSIVDKDTIYTNSFHHQAVDKLGKDLIVNCRSKDGLVEGVEHKEKQILGVQWHPENLWKNTEENILLFNWLVSNC
ncbi:gamma-glutamyl-gamma-aminobutyrate hydrolase family protein [Proteinivorax hydrogeniformans]|uniref:Gamma-glutamyl-gamma-aminobutyrate hydrolase family protein n=1 Tax=Proteinivorax hydrogeniformans TaxID=1826727 RepID=A0AAU8HSD7_9FIRM